jgi:large subunit ribosomal protein L10
MAKSKEQKATLLGRYKDLIDSKNGYILVNSKDIDTATTTTLKMKLKEIGSDYSVVKNTLFKVALQESNQPVELQDLDGPTAVIVFDEDPTTPAKLLKEIQKETELLSAKAGIFEGEYLTGEKVMQLAEIPSREVLLSQLMSSMNAPLSGTMNTLIGNVRGLVMVLKGLSEKEA